MKLKGKLIKTCLIFASYMLVIFITWTILKHYNLTSITTLKHICNQNAIGIIVFILLQIIQVLFLPISSVAFTIPAIIIFGSIKAFIISFIGLIIGSIIMFYFGRYGGIKLLQWVVGKNQAVYYTRMLGKGKLILPILMIAGIFPDDLLCAAAGLSNIKFGYFFTVVLLSRAIDLSCICFIGPTFIKSTLGIILLIVFVIIAVIFSIYITRNQEKLENWLTVTTTKLKNKN